MKPYLDMVQRTEHPRWPGLHASILAKVGEHHATKPHRFYAECFADYCDDARTQVSDFRVFRTEAEAEAHARLFFETMLPHWEESIRTHGVPETPFSRYAAAMRAHIADATRTLREAYETADAEAGADVHERVLWSHRDACRHALRRAESDAEHEFRTGRCWSEFLRAP